MNALRRTEEPRPRALEARVSNPDPADFTVTIDDFDGHELARHAWPAVSWPVSPTAAPARGDRCLVVPSEIGSVWVVAAEWSGPALTWRSLDLRNAWQAESPDSTPSWARSPTGWVVLRGVATTTDPGGNQEILALPRQLPPAYRSSFPALIRQNLVARVLVLTGGRIETGALPSSAGAATVTLDGIAYWPED